jgi:hypothetical protein
VSKKSKTWQAHQSRILKRWSEEDYPGGAPRFQLRLLAKDMVAFCLIPVGAIVIFKLIESGLSSPQKPSSRRLADSSNQKIEKQSQIVLFHSGSRQGAINTRTRRSPGTLVRVKLLNVVETFSDAPVQAQIIDAALGREYLGGILLGDAVSEIGSGRIKILFRFVRHPSRPDLGVPIAARAMNLDGTFGLNAEKKEGFFARAVMRATPGGIDTNNSKEGGEDFKTIVARAVAAGMMQELESEGAVANNKAQVLTLKPFTEFFVELTDYFPGKM